jgi:4-hydroxybenzoate polyprenyltransferase
MKNSASQRVSDAPADIWVYRMLPQWVWPYAQLARWDRPIGWWLLLWPCWWSLALATVAGMSLMGQMDPGEGSIVVVNYLAAVDFFLFWLGAVMMRGAGCTYNDIVDADIDSQVARTASRPIPSGRVTRQQTVVFLVLQAAIGFFCLLALSWFGRPEINWFAMVLGIASLAIVTLYPFAKRVINWPQFVLGLAFSWGALMGWAVAFGSLALPPLLLYAGSILWVIGYDTIYAHQDKEDDALIGIRSTARLFGRKTKPALVLLYSVAIWLFFAAFVLAGAGWPSLLGLTLGALHMIWQIHVLDIDDADNCLALFKSNTRFGWIIFAGLVLDIFF